MSEHGQALIKGLQDKIEEALVPLFPENGQFALLDYPDHSNVGDSAIWLGEVAYFEKVHGRNPAYVSELYGHCSGALKRAVPEGTIYLHGGGNFGDLWPKHQAFREKIIQEFPDHAIVQMPQSIHFDDPKALERSAEIINKHANFTLLVRDRKSLAIAEEHFTCRTLLCPDMAFFIGAIERPVEASRSLLFLLRRDHENASFELGDDVAQALEEFPAEDWSKEDTNFKDILKCHAALGVLPVLCLKAFDREARRYYFFKRLAGERVGRGLRQLSCAEFVIADRLHVHILCLLLGQAHVRLDNSYGKISNFAKEWTAQSDISVECTDLEAAYRVYVERDVQAASGKAA